MENTINVNKDTCITCHACEKDCPMHNIMIQDNVAVVKDQDCMKCGHCEAICPNHAITIDGYQDDVIDVVNQCVDADVLLHAIKQRRSIRQFQTTSISRKEIEQILEAGRYTPTAQNKQEVSYIVLQREIKEIEQIAIQLFRKLWPFASLYNKAAKHMELDDHFFFKNAPLVILVVAKGSFAKVDGSLASSNMALVAEALGLGVLYSGLFTMAIKFSRKLRKKLSLQRSENVVMTMVIGRPSVRYHKSVHRKPIQVHYR